jgi:hypothetical protein
VPDHLDRHTAAARSGPFFEVPYIDLVNAVKIVGVDNGVGSPGFDVAYVEGLEGSIVQSPIPLPAGLPLLAAGIATLVLVRRR